MRSDKEASGRPVKRLRLKTFPIGCRHAERRIEFLMGSPVVVDSIARSRDDTLLAGYYTFLEGDE